MTMPATPPHEITSRAEFQEAVRGAFAQAAQIGCREILLCDPDFADWPLDEPALLDPLTRWALPHRQFTVLAQRYDALQRRHPRWVDFRRNWAHVVACHALNNLEPGQMPTLLLVPGIVTLRLFDPVRYRGRVSADAAEGLRAREQFDALLQQSSEAFPATVLGL